jgi:hypothetical protein
MDRFPKSLPQANPIAAQKTLWLEYLHPQLRRNVTPYYSIIREVALEKRLPEVTLILTPSDAS